MCSEEFGRVWRISEEFGSLDEFGRVRMSSEEFV